MEREASILMSNDWGEHQRQHRDILAAVLGHPGVDAAAAVAEAPAAVVVAVAVVGAAAAVAAWCIAWPEAWDLAAHVRFAACQAAWFVEPGQVLCWHVLAAVVVAAAAAAAAGGTVLAELPCVTGLEDIADAADAAELGPVGPKREQLIC